MKRIIVTCDDSTAVTISQLLIDQAIGFSMEPVPNGSPSRTVPRKHRRNYKPLDIHRTQRVVLTAAATRPNFRVAELAPVLEEQGYSPNSASPAVSELVSMGMLARGDLPGYYTITEKGTKALAKAKEAHP